MVFDGRTEAKKIEVGLAASGRLRGRSLLILQCDENKEESTYVRLKREMGERLGANVRTQELPDYVEDPRQSRDKNFWQSQITLRMTKQLKETLKSKEIESFGGILVQLPILGAGREETEEILSLIPVEKDVDGLNSRSEFKPAASLAVLRILKLARVQEGRRIGVVGASGAVGKRLMRDLAGAGYPCLGFDLGDDLKGLLVCDTIVSATGTAGLITAEMVREGVVAVDLGFPKGDFAPEVAEKASFFTPVPGGVGPLTIVCLYENLARVD